MWGKVFPLSFQGYLAYQIVGSVFVNALVNAAFAWPMRGQDGIMTFGGWGSVACDTCVSGVLLSGLTVAFGSFFVRKDLRDGKVRPAPDCLARFPSVAQALRSTTRRAFAFAAVFAPPGVAVACLLLVLLPPSLSFKEFLAFKLSFACLLGAVVTPLNVLWVLAETPQWSQVHPSTIGLKD